MTDPSPDTAHTHSFERHCDVVVIGGSVAGLAGALQLVRQRRSVIVVDDHTPRNAPAAHMHGYLGSDGVSPSELTSHGRAEVRSYGGEILTGRVRSVERRADGLFRVQVGGGHAVVARRVLAATGLVDELPDIAGLADHWGSGVIHCPFCHGFEARDRRLVQIVTSPLGLHPATLFRHLSACLTLVIHDAPDVDDASLEAFTRDGVEVLRAGARRIVNDVDGRIVGVELDDGRQIDADVVVVGTRFQVRADVLADLGVTTAPHASGLGDVVEVDPMTGETSASGVYAAGNLTDPTMQVAHAAAHGSRVAAAVALDLAAADLSAAARPSGDATEWDRRYSGDAPVWSGNPNGTMVDQVAKLDPGRVLDVGAGEGGDAIWLAERGWAATATDISGHALARVAAEAERRGLEIECLHRDANELDAFDAGTFDLVSMQYGSIHRTPDRRALTNLLGAVAPGGTLLVVGHDHGSMHQHIDVELQTHMFDPHAYVGVGEIADALADDSGWTIELHETVPRPPGAASTQHVDDVVLRATRLVDLPEYV